MNKNSFKIIENLTLNSVKFLLLILSFLSIIFSDFKAPEELDIPLFSFKKVLFVIVFLNIALMIRLNNNKKYIFKYLVISSIAIGLFTIAETGILTFDLRKNEYDNIKLWLQPFVFMAVYAIGPFRFLISEEMEKNAKYYLAILPSISLPFLFAWKHNVILAYIFLTLFSSTILFIYRYKKLNNFLFAELLTIAFVVWFNFYSSTISIWSFLAPVLIMLYTYLSSNFYKNPGVYYIGNFCSSFLPLLFGINEISAFITIVLLIFVSVTEFAGRIEYKINSNLLSTSDFLQEFKFQFPALKLPQKKLTIKLNLSFTIALIFIIIALIIRFSDV